MPSRDVYRTGVYGLATKAGSADDATEYISTKAAQTFYAALLDPNATTIRRKSGTKWPKRQHKLVYNTRFSTIRYGDVTKDMELITNEKTITSTDQRVHVLIPVLNAKATFHAQTSYPYETYSISGKPPMTTTQKRKSLHRANVDGSQRWNKDRDW